MSSQIKLCTDINLDTIRPHCSGTISIMLCPFDRSSFCTKLPLEFCEFNINSRIDRSQSRIITEDYVETTPSLPEQLELSSASYTAIKRSHPISMQPLSVRLSLIKRSSFNPCIHLLFQTEKPDWNIRKVCVQRKKKEEKMSINQSFLVARTP